MATVEEPERRIEWLEEQMRHVLPQKVDAAAYGVSLVHEDVREIKRTPADRSLQLGDLRQEVTRSGQRLDQVAAEVSSVTRSQIEHGAAVAQVAGKVDGLAGKVDGLAGKVDGLAGKVDGLAGQADGQGETLASHGQMLAEILRRLPSAPE